jgi:hypothetical protein
MSMWPHARLRFVSVSAAWAQLVIKNIGLARGGPISAERPVCTVRTWSDATTRSAMGGTCSARYAVGSLSVGGR